MNCTPMAYLDHFGHSVRELAGGEGLKESGIDKDVFGLPERAGQVFAMGGVLDFTDSPGETA